MELGIPALLIPYCHTRIYFGDLLGGMPALLVRWIPISCLQHGHSLWPRELETNPCRHPNLPLRLLQYLEITSLNETKGLWVIVGNWWKQWAQSSPWENCRSSWSWSLSAHLNYMCCYRLYGYITSTQWHLASFCKQHLPLPAEPQTGYEQCSNFFWQLPRHCQGTPSLLP